MKGDSFSLRNINIFLKKSSIVKISGIWAGQLVLALGNINSVRTEYIFNEAQCLGFFRITKEKAFVLLPSPELALHLKVSL